VGQAKRVQNRTSVLWFDIKNGSSESLMCGSGGASLGGPAGPLPFPPPKKKQPYTSHFAHKKGGG